MNRHYKSEDPKTTHRRLTATELRKLPKAERERILEAQFKLGGKLYAEDPGSIIQASQRIHD